MTPPAGATRRSQAFASEADLVTVVADRIDQLLHPNPAATTEPRAGWAEHTLYEIPAAYGIPDITHITLHTDAIQARRRAGLEPVLDYTPLKALTAISDGPISVDDLAATTAISRGHLLGHILPRLAELGWTHPVTGRGRGAEVTSRTRHRDLAEHTCAVEAKLADWRHAIGQARRLLHSADTVYVALDAARARPALDIADGIAAAGIGIITADAAGTATLVTQPATSHTPQDSAHRLLAERAWWLIEHGRSRWDTFPVFGRTLTVGDR